MTMPKKGIRKIVVDGKTYRYIIKYSRGKVPFWNNIGTNRLTVESADTNDYFSIDIKQQAITPIMVEDCIRCHMREMDKMTGKC